MCILVCVYIYIYIYICIHTHVRVTVHTCAYTRVYIYIYIHTYIHIHIEREIDRKRKTDDRSQSRSQSVGNAGTRKHPRNSAPGMPQKRSAPETRPLECLRTVLVEKPAACWYKIVWWNGLRYDMAWWACDLAESDMVWHDMMWYDVPWGDAGCVWYAILLCMFIYAHVMCGTVTVW